MDLSTKDIIIGVRMGPTKKTPGEDIQDNESPPIKLSRENLKLTKRDILT